MKGFYLFVKEKFEIFKDFINVWWRIFEYVEEIFREKVRLYKFLMGIRFVY